MSRTIPRQQDVTSSGSDDAVVLKATTELPREMATTQSTDTEKDQVSSTTESPLDTNAINPDEPMSTLSAPTSTGPYPALTQPLAWEVWTYWSQCSASCGQGSRLRWKLCQNDSNGTATCDMEMGREISEYSWVVIELFYIQSI